MIRFCIALLLLASLVGCSSQKLDPKVAATYDASFGISGERLQSSAIMVMFTRGELSNHFGAPAPEAVQRYRDAQADFRRQVEYYKLSNFTRFIIAGDSLTRVIITYPEARVVREPR